MEFGIFDLHKNEHELLFIKEAPQVILFAESNKKQMKMFRKREQTVEEDLRLWINDEVEAGPDIDYRDSKETLIKQ